MMPADMMTEPPRETIVEIEASLEAMMARLRAILTEEGLSQDTLVEIISLYNNVAYIFLYLEATDDFGNFERLKPWRERFYDDGELLDRILAMLRELRCSDPEAEQSRLNYIAQLEKRRRHDRDSDRRIDELLSEAKEIAERREQHQVALLERLGVSAGQARPAVLFYKLISGNGNPLTRQKLTRAWALQRDRHASELASIVDQMIGIRWVRSTAEGYDSVLAQTLERCRVSAAEVEIFLEQSLQQALVSFAAMEAEVQQLVGPVERPIEHFEYAIRTMTRAARTPLFALDDCLDYIFRVTHSVFGLDLERFQEPGRDLITVLVRSNGVDVGQIKLDLWVTGGKASGPNHTRGLRNRTAWAGLTQLPVAFVSCHFTPGAGGTNGITFQNVHSLFHEFGHAVNHLLVRKRVSDQSGLEYLPPERLEYLSMWYEKWAYHPEFARYVPGADAATLARCARLVMLETRRTYVERAVLALMDLNVHRHRDRGLRESFDQLDLRFDVSRYLSFGELPEYFTWPMYVTHPGANFSYLWGSADSCTKFEPFRGLSLSDIAERSDLRALFHSSFDFEAASGTPDPIAVYTFYDEAHLKDLA